MREGKPMLLLHPNCKMLRKGFNGKYGYRRLHTSQEKYVDKPDKNDFSHIHDALQYVATYLFADRLRGFKEVKKTDITAPPTFNDLLNSQSNTRQRV